MRGGFEIKKTKDNKFHYTLKAENNEILVQSETFEAKQSAIKGIVATINVIVGMVKSEKIMVLDSTEQEDVKMIITPNKELILDITDEDKKMIKGL